MQASTVASAEVVVHVAAAHLIHGQGFADTDSSTYTRLFKIKSAIQNAPHDNIVGERSDVRLLGVFAIQQSRETVQVCLVVGFS